MKIILINVAYLWHDVPGLQKFGSFEGTNDAMVNYVELGFRPAIMDEKNVEHSQSNNW